MSAPAPPAPEPGEVEKLIEKLRKDAEWHKKHNEIGDAEWCDRLATALATAIRERDEARRARFSDAIEAQIARDALIAEVERLKRLLEDHR